MSYVLRGSCYLIGIFFVLLLCYSILPTLFYIARAWCGRKEVKKRTLFLTFDEGPSYKYTTELLELLERHRVKATFFVRPSAAKRNPILIQRMKRAGHTIQLKGLAYGTPLLTGPLKTTKSLKSAEQILKEENVNVTAFRPAHGCLNLSVLWYLRKHRIHLEYWNVLASDRFIFENKGSIASRMYKRTRPGRIFFLHDGETNDHTPLEMLEALKIMIPYWINLGYEFECIK